MLAWGLGLVQCENLNKGRATGPWVTVDAADTDEGAISDTGIAATTCAGEDGLQTIQWQSINWTNGPYTMQRIIY